MTPRQTALIALLEAEGSQPISRLAARLAVSDETARRDVAQLAAAGRLVRVHGAVGLAGALGEAPYARRMRENAAAKRAIAAAAAAMIADGVTMMLDVDFASLRTGMLQYAPIGVVIGGILFLELLLVGGSYLMAPTISGAPVVPIDQTIDNTRALGQVIYTRYVFLFQGAGAVLLVAMVGAIVLTLQHKPNVKRQDALKQSTRTRTEATELVKVKTGQGL